MPYPRPWYVRIDWPLWFTGAVLALVWYFFVQAALAGGPVALTWNQATDCASVTGWELLVAPITTANPNPPPTSATVGVTLVNNVPPCGMSMSRTVNVSGVGQSRFWLRAVAGATKSAESNSIDASMPLGKPDGLQVAPQ